MKLNKFVTATGVALGAGALALAPTAHAATPIAGLTVSSTTASGNLQAPASVTMDVYGTPTTLSCSGGSQTGAWNTSAAATAPLTFSALSMSCASFIAGTVSLSVVSPLTFVPDASNKVTTGSTDVITGTIDATTNKVKVTVTGGCTLYITGKTTAKITEAATGNATFSLTGTGFKVASSPAPTLGCLGAVAGGSTLTMNNVNFDLGGSPNFTP